MTDPAALGIAALIGVLGTLAGVFAGGALNEYWAAKREQRANERADAKARVDRLREDRLEVVDQTRRGMVAMLNFLSAKAAGNPAYAAIATGLDTYPRLNMSMLDDPKVLEFYLALCANLTVRAPGSGFSPADNDRVATAQTAIQAVLERQRQRALNDSDLPMIADDDVATLRSMDEAYRALGLTPPTRRAGEGDDAPA